MKYQNASGILPKELIETIQQYVQGKYIYIPIKDKVGQIYDFVDRNVDRIINQLHLPVISY